MQEQEEKKAVQCDCEHCDPANCAYASEEHCDAGSQHAEEHHHDHSHPEEHLLPEEVILAASKGDQEALQQVVDYYAPDIDAMATVLRQVDGKWVKVVDEERKKKMTEQIIASTLRFVPR